MIFFSTLHNTIMFFSFYFYPACNYNSSPTASEKQWTARAIAGSSSPVIKSYTVLCALHYFIFVFISVLRQSANWTRDSQLPEKPSVHRAPLLNRARFFVPHAVPYIGCVFQWNSSAAVKYSRRAKFPASLPSREDSHPIPVAIDQSARELDNGNEVFDSDRVDRIAARRYRRT